ncbi:PRC-barrel domain-containing protein [Variovorax sp. LARHSF232]
MPINSMISSGRVQGTNVYNPDGDKLGTIDHLIINKFSGQVRYAVMEFGGFLGIGSDRYPIPWRLLTYDKGLGGYVVPLSTPKLEGAPRYSKDAAPAYDEAYGAAVNGYYGV